MAAIIVKLGGAAITNKSIADTLSTGLDNLIEQVAQAYCDTIKPAGGSLILIHGAGSFGHPPAKQYGVKGGWTSRPTEAQDEAKMGMVLTRQRVLQLHYHIISRLHAQGLPVLSVSTYDTIETARGELTPASSTRLVERVHHVLSEGFIPLLFGDAVFDQEWGSTIFSGDAIMYHLAMNLPSARGCAFLTDVSGAYTKDPKHFADASLIPRLHHAQDLQHKPEDSRDGSIKDVTGSMQSKCKWAQKIKADAKGLQHVFICHAKDCNEALAALIGEGDGADGVEKWTTIT